MFETAIGAAFIGLASGAVYTMIAVGLSLGFRSGGLINIALGDVAVLAAYVGSSLIGAGLSYWIVLVLVSVGTGLLLAALDRVLLRFVYGSSPVYPITITVGISAILEAAMTWHWGGNPLVYKPALGSSVVHLGSVVLFVKDLVALGICLAVVAALTTALRYTSVGRDVRAGASDPVAARLCGVPVARARTISLALSGVLAGLGGMILAALVPLYPTTGLDVLLAAFVGAVIGGFGSMWGALVGSLVVGLVEGIAATFEQSVFSSVYVYVLLGLILIVRPAGLFGEEGVGLREV